MIKTCIYPSVLAIKDEPESWDARISAVPVPISGIHYDIGDGDFVPSLMLPVEHISFLHGDVSIDVHLMVQHPSQYFEKILLFPHVSAVALHVECRDDIHETITFLKNAGKKVGLALLENTPADHLDNYLLEIDYVLVMTVKGGYSGTLFIPEALSKIIEIRNKRPELPIVVDGGIGEKTLPLCLESGATGAVMSSALFSSSNFSWLL